MQQALHPDKNILISVAQYIQEFGNKPLNGIDSRPKCRCQLCKQEVFEKHMSTVSSSQGNFSHYPNRGYCPIKSQSVASYIHCVPAMPNKQRALRLKQQFRKNWRQHYKQISHLAKNLKPIEFIQLLTRANQQRIWEYDQLQEYQLPYVLVTLVEFPNQTGNYKNKRHCWFRFWFDSSVQVYDDIWRTNTLPELWRAYYYLTGKQRTPSEDNLKNLSSFHMNKDFLTWDDKLPQFIIDDVEKWFTSHHFGE